ncbi:hypothetical protein [Desulfoferrobacter suflitae]|uniref:hypothetical protein n=1 Tax=Desulfoferrobacter suflitae TaxID=2865782 RepID=UPI0021643DEF|nr:hypothetical protein [Desulfoferrobacter suflitae]MCK8602483.1 hypothetical protein [Desulfoferrobacter suflitae]
MSGVNLKRTVLSVGCLIVILTLSIWSGTDGYGQDLPSDPCPVNIEVSPSQVNIDAGGVAHYVRVLTYARYVNTAEAFVYVNDNEFAMASEFIELTRDSVGHLVVKIDLNGLKLEESVHTGLNTIHITVIPREPTDGCAEYSGMGDLYITNKKGL